MEPHVPEAQDPREEFFSALGERPDNRLLEDALGEHADRIFSVIETEDSEK